jgi:hypothetical protein
MAESSDQVSTVGRDGLVVTVGGRRSGARVEEVGCGGHEATRPFGMMILNRSG